MNNDKMIVVAKWALRELRALVAVHALSTREDNFGINGRVEAAYKTADAMEERNPLPTKELT